MPKEQQANEQSERFKQAARELGCDDGEALERAFGKIVPPRRPQKPEKGNKPETKTPGL